MDEATFTDLYGADPTPVALRVPAAAPASARPPRAAGEGPTAGRRLKRFVADHLPGIDNANDIRVWLLLHIRAGEGDTVKLSHAAIAKHFGFTSKTSVRTVKRLRAAGLLKVKRQGGFPDRVTVYRIVAGKSKRPTRPAVPATARDSQVSPA